jgi:S1-C subfamily serine protease
VAVAALLAGPVRLAVFAGRDGGSSTGGSSAPSPSSSSSAASAAPAATAPPQTQDLAAVYRQSAGGVVRIETTACGGGGVGSGFLIAPDYVATVAHVVANAHTVAVRDDDQDASAVVVGFDESRDLALVRLSHSLSGHVFHLATTEPDVGTTVAAIGYPLAGPRSLSRGAVSGLNRSGDMETAYLTGLIQTDAAINPGNSGGPLLDASGTVVGLVDAKSTQGEGIGYAIPADAAAGLLHSWQDSPRPQYASNCDDPYGSSTVHAQVSVDANHPDAAGIAETLASYATGINTGDYDTSYDDLGPTSQAQDSRQEFAATHTSSYLFDLHLEAVTSTVAGDEAVVRFTSVQDPDQGHNGQTCSIWLITYRMIVEPGSDGHWLIDRATAAGGYPRPCR